MRTDATASGVERQIPLGWRPGGAHSVFDDLEDLLSPVVAATRADPMRDLGIPTLRALVNGHALGLEMGPALALALLGCAFLRYGHDSLALQVPQCPPPGIDVTFGASTRTFIQIRAAPKAKPFALGIADHIRIYREDQLLANCYAQLQLRSLRLKGVRSTFLVRLRTFRDEHQRDVAFERSLHGLQAASAFPPKRSVGVTPCDNLPRSRERRPQLHGYVPGPTEIGVLPEFVFCGNAGFHVDRTLTVQLPEIDSEHSRKS